AIAFRNLKQGSICVTHGYSLLRITVENRMGWLNDLGLDNRSWRIELRRRSSGINVSRKTKLRRKETCAAKRYKQPTVVYEFLKLAPPQNSHPPGDFRLFTINPHIFKPLSFCICNRLAPGLDVETHPFPATTLIGNYDYIVRTAQVALL